MIATNITTLRDNIKEYFDRVVEDCETMIVTRRNDENVVVISQREWESLQETLYLMSTKANRDMLARSIAQLEGGKGKKRELVCDE